MDWDESSMLNAGKRGKYSSLSEALAKSQNQQDSIAKSVQMFEQIKPLLMKHLEQKLQNRDPIRVFQPIEVVTERINKSADTASCSITGTVIPSGIELVFDGMELGQIFFKGFRAGKETGEYSVHLGENIVIGTNQVVRNKGLMGLLTKTNVMTEVLEYLKQS